AAQRATRAAVSASENRCEGKVGLMAFASHFLATSDRHRRAGGPVAGTDRASRRGRGSEIAGGRDAARCDGSGAGPHPKECLGRPRAGNGKIEGGRRPSKGNSLPTKQRPAVPTHRSWGRWHNSERW